MEKKKILLTIAVYDTRDGDLYTKVLGLFDSPCSDGYAEKMVMDYISDNYSVKPMDSYDDFISATMSKGVIVSEIQYTEL